MIELENYKSNLDILDKHDVKNIKIGTGKVYTGSTRYINPQIKKIEHGSPLLAAAILGLDNTGAPIPENSKYFDIWTDIDAQEKYLNTKPTCYIILGKHGTGSFNLGEAMAKKYNIIHLCPKNILLDEILQKSITGRTWDFNMKLNKVCCYDLILTMLKIKLNSEVVRHRGYVISGLPLVTASRNPLCYIDTLYGEEGLSVVDEILLDTIRNLKKKKLKAGGSGPSSVSSEMQEEEKVEEEASPEQQEEGLEEEQDIPAELPKFLLDTCSNVIITKKSRFESKLAAFLSQLDELFNLILKPDIIIHITCPELDLIKIRGNNYINCKTGVNTNQPFISNYKPEPSWPRKCSTSDYNNTLTSNVFNPKYNCKPPSNYEDKIIEQICNYKTYVYPYIEKKLKDFDPKMVIELDGRTTCGEMLNHVAQTLILIQIPPVLIPQPLFLEEPPEDMEEFWENTVAGLDVISSHVVNFKYYASPWFTRCPVELKFRRTVRGRPKYAVKFFKHVYLMSSLNNFIAFYKNPRPYLKLTYLEPICRVIVTGTKSSGKTMISQCLSWIFNAPILNFETIVKTEKEKKYDRTVPTILSEIIATIEDARLHEWETLETDRVTKLNDWYTSTQKLLRKYLPLLIQITAYNAKMLREAEIEEKIRAAKKEKKRAALTEKLLAAQNEKLKAEKELRDIEEELNGKEKQMKGKEEQLKGKVEELQRKEEELKGKEEELKKIEEDLKALEEDRSEDLRVEEEDQKDETSKKEEKTVKSKEIGDGKQKKRGKKKENWDAALQSEFDDLKTQLSYLPILDNIEECNKALDIDNLSPFAPIELLTAKAKPSIPVLGDEDVTIAITNYIEANQLQKELEPTPEEIMTEIIKLLTAIDIQHQTDTQSEQLYGKYIIDGFPSDPAYWEYISDAKFSPDYTIGLIENREINEELYQYYSESDEKTRSYWEKMLLIKDPLIHTKLQTTKLDSESDTDSNVQNIVQNIITQMIDLMLMKTSTLDEQSSANQFIASFTEAIDKFREGWDSLKLKIEDKSKCYIEIEIGDKKDVEVIEEMLRKLRQCFRPRRVELQDEEALITEEDEDDLTTKGLLTYNDNRFLCETNIYCPIAYHDHNILWEGNPEFSLKYDNKIHYFCKEQFLELFQADITKYQFYNIPFKKIPRLKICVIGSIGCGATSLSKIIAKELGLLHIDFAHIINEYLVPKHFKKIGRHYENTFVDGPIDEEGVVEFQLDEENVNLVSDILANEKELTRMLRDYLERGTPVLSKLMQKIILKIWDDSSSPIGFVLDGYPKIPNDVEDMLACYAIPDLVITLENNAETALKRIAPIMTKSWKSQQNEAKQAAAAKFDIEHKLWFHAMAKQIVPKLIMEEVYDNIFVLKLTKTTKQAPVAKSGSADSILIDANPSGASNVDPVLIKLYNNFIEQYPEPQDTNVWEKIDEAQERIESRIENIFDTEEENVQSLNEILLENRIKTISVDASKPFKKVTRYTLTKLGFLKNRCESFFEQTFIVEVDIAEKLLSSGFYFFSKFHRLCPVYIFENPLAIQNSYSISKRNGTLFPVIHRSFIYFISSENNVTKFRTNPLKYITSEAIKSFFEYPLRIGVIGTPKSGQSTLAARLTKQYGLLCISGGSAVRTILENFHWTELANEMRKCLKAGKKIEEDHIVKAMQTVAINPRTVTCGYVLDGAPFTPYRAKGHVKSCIFPNIIFDICSHKSRILENSQNEIYYDILKYMPPYPYDLIQIRYENWEKRQYKVRSWIAENYQNLHLLDGNQSKWRILQQANDHINLLTSKLHYYVTNVDEKIVRAMWISDEAFQARQSQYKNMCPVCFHKKVYKYMGPFFGGKTGVVQYQNKFYWICSEHMDLVMAFPNSYLTSEDIEIPEIPALIHMINLDYIYENGICVVTYAENLPAQILKMGTNQYAASYAGKSYLFCSEVCLCKFISKPYLFKDITIFKESKNFPKMSLKSLPNIGYLEQTLGNMLTEACIAVNAFRPKYPGLSFQTSAFIYIALYLKTHNPLTDKTKMPMYLKAFKIFEARCKLMLSVGLRLRSMDNPFASYPKCLHREPTLNPAELCPTLSLNSALLKKSLTALKRSSVFVQMNKPSYLQKLPRRVPVPDERFDYLCEFHKPVSKVPAFLNVVDIAGLVKGAAEGQGLGNAFLSHIKACDAIFNLCRAFDDEDVIHVDGEVNPVRDLETIGEELRLKDEEQLVQNFEKLDKLVNRGGDKKLKSEYDSLSKIKTVLVDEKKHIRFGDWSAADIEVLNKYLFLTSKPALYLVNLSEKDYIRKKNKWLPKLKEWIDKNDPGAPLIPFSGSLELKLFDMDPAERQSFLKEHNLTSALDKIIVQGYKALQLEYFFTAGPDEVKAWTIQKGTKAPQAAGRIHTDFEKGFIMAEVMHYKDFKEEGTEAACKAAGKYRQQGRNYVVEDGDIIFFKFNAGAGLKDPKKK